MHIYFFDTPSGHDHPFIWVMAPSEPRARMECWYLFRYRPRGLIAGVAWWNAQAAWDSIAGHRDGKGMPLPDREVLKMSTSNWRRTRPPRGRIMAAGSDTGTHT